MQTQRRYRILFHVRFEHDIEAESPEAARLIANDMRDNGWSPLMETILAGTPELSVAWSTIEPLGEVEAAK